MSAKVIRLLAFALLTGGLTAWIALEITDTGFGDRYRLTATFDDVTGLWSGDDVKLAGVPVGKVGGISVERGRAVVTLHVDEGVPVPADTEVAVRWRNLLGQRFVELRPGSSGQLLGHDDRIETTRSVVDLGQLVNQLGPLAGAVDPHQLNEIIEALATALVGSTQTVTALTGDLTVVLGTLAERDDTIRRIISDYAAITGTVAQRDEQIQTMVDNLVLLSRAFADNTALVDRALVELSGFAVDLDELLSGNADALDRLLENLSLVSGTVVDNLDTLEAAVAGLPGTLRDLFSTVDSGTFLKTNVLCTDVTPAPCSTPMVLPGDERGRGSSGGQPRPLSSPEDFTRMLVGAAR